MKKKCCMFTAMGLFLASCIISCIWKQHKNLDSWLGEYSYSETFPHNSGELSYFVNYTVEIYKQEGKYYAQITGDGWQTCVRCLARVTGNRNKVELTYMGRLSDDITSIIFDRGETLWRFEREDNDINTVWLAGKALHPTLSDMEGEIVRKSFEMTVESSAVQEEQSVERESEPLTVQEGQKESEIVTEENEQAADGEDDVAAVCELVRAMDVTVEQPHMELTEEEDRAYKEAFLRLLKNELPIKGGEKWCEDGDRYQDLWWSGIPYEDLLEGRDNADFSCFYYYDDIDGDGKPEFGVSQGAVYFFDYELGEGACSVSYGGQRIYFKGLLGDGKIWEHDNQHAWVERFRYIVLNSDGEWEEVLQLELYYAEEEETIYTKYYKINGVNVEKEVWEELTAPFYAATGYEIPKKTLAEVFGELLEDQ